MSDARCDDEPDSGPGSVGRGRIRWGRFAGILGLGLFGVALVMLGVARGAIAASFTVSGTSFKASADRLEGEGFVQFVGVDQGTDGAHPVAVSGFRSAVADNFCQSVYVRSVPLVGDLTLRMTSEGPAGMSASGMVLGVDGLSGDLTLVEPDLGVDAAAVGKGPDGLRGPPGGFGMQATKATVTTLRMTAWSATAHTLRLKNLQLALRPGAHECH
jgi:hypothetical protein